MYIYKFTLNGADLELRDALLSGELVCMAGLDPSACNLLIPAILIIVDAGMFRAVLNILSGILVCSSIHVFLHVFFQTCN